ncbi:hypothetical protein OOT46_23925 [Aquabacterium sp. A7-Y]|uniref:hypothetical protein n=1 Tax=Aquabacterium sp. A7-Y TaxID=1349605 RepID=UPI00223DD745|nr:hypothetical protein [Aquabacterium sp. A7-Y]MCW7540874.1 hypothetical protein [Aquabacterium sp. A7-Y]
MAADAAQLREAALALHALVPSVRQQVLATLDADQRARLEPLLEELNALGLPTSLARAAAADAPARSGSLDDRLAALPADALAAALLTQGAATAAAALGVIDATRQAELLALLPEERRSAIERAQSQSPRLGPLARQALAEALLTAARRQCEAGAGARRTGLLSKVRAWMR